MNELKWNMLVRAYKPASKTPDIPPAGYIMRYAPVARAKLLS
jgi:hypothetical protein